MLVQMLKHRQNFDCVTCAPRMVRFLAAENGGLSLLFICLRGSLTHSIIAAMRSMEFGSIMMWFFVADRTSLLVPEDKEYVRDRFGFIFLTLILVAGWTSTAKVKAAVLLNRQQTEEWKGWMQVRVDSCRISIMLDPDCPVFPNAAQLSPCKWPHETEGGERREFRWRLLRITPTFTRAAMRSKRLFDALRTMCTQDDDSTADFRRCCSCCTTTSMRARCTTRSACSLPPTSG